MPIRVWLFFKTGKHINIYDMKLQDIREQLIQQLENDINNWNDVLNDTNPGIYGVEEWDILVPEEGFYVDIPNKTFSFKNVDFSADLVLGASKGESSFVQKYNKPAKGTGSFDFASKDEVQIISIQVDIDPDIF